MPNVPNFAADKHRAVTPPVSTQRHGRLNIGIIGAGKVGAVLGAALRTAQHEIIGVSASSEESKERAELLLPKVPLQEPEAIARYCDLALLAVPDNALSSLVHQLHAAECFHPGQLVLHTSGGYGISVLSEARKSGAIPLAIHPAMSFTGTSLDLTRLKETVFGVTADAAMIPIAQALVFEIGGEPVVIAEADRSLYHAAVAHAANHLMTLVAQSSQILTDIGVADPARLLAPVLKASLDNTLHCGEDALTGPVARGDYHTVAAHARAMLEYDKDIAASYRDLALATAQRVFARNMIDENSYRKLLQVFGANFFEIDPELNS